MTDVSQAVRLSVAVLVRDAADPLRRTLASIRDIADEILVVDTGSQDRSPDVAREFGARIIEQAWSDDFSAARNEGLRQATGDWVLWLDAGETLRDAEARTLRQFVATSARPDQAYLLLVRVPAIDSQAADEQVGRVRLVARHPALRFAGRVRESLDASLAAAGVLVSALPVVIRRGEREHDPRLKKRRAQRNIQLAELEIREQGPAARLWNCLGDACQTLGDNTRALTCFRQGVSEAPRGSPEMLEGYYGLWTSLDGDSRVPARAEQLKGCVEALEIYPLDAQLLCALGGYLHAERRTALALQAYLTAYQYGQVQPAVWHVPDIRDVAAVCYSVLLQFQQRSDEAVDFLETAVREQPDSLRLRRRLIDVHVGRGNREAALVHVGALPDGSSQQEALRSAVRGACYAVHKNWVAAKVYLQAAYQHGCRDALCYKWLTTTLLASGEADAARPLLEQWQAVEPRNPEPSRLLAGITPPAAATPPSGDRQVRFDGPAVPGLGTGPTLPAANVTSPHR